MLTTDQVFFGPWAAPRSGLEYLRAVAEMTEPPTDETTPATGAAVSDYLGQQFLDGTPSKALRALAEAGLLVNVDPRPRPPAYVLTDAGRAALRVRC